MNIVILGHVGLRPFGGRHKAGRAKILFGSMKTQKASAISSPQVSVGLNIISSLLILACILLFLHVGVNESPSWGFSGPQGFHFAERH